MFIKWRSVNKSAGNRCPINLDKVWSNIHKQQKYAYWPSSQCWTGSNMASTGKPNEPSDAKAEEHKCLLTSFLSVQTNKKSWSIVQLRPSDRVTNSINYMYLHHQFLRDIRIWWLKFTYIRASILNGVSYSVRRS